MLSYFVEMEKTYIVLGKPRSKNNKDADNESQSPKRGRGIDKKCVSGMIERAGKIRTKHYFKQEGDKLGFKSLNTIASFLDFVRRVTDDQLHFVSSQCSSNYFLDEFSFRPNNKTNEFMFDKVLINLVG